MSQKRVCQLGEIPGKAGNPRRATMTLVTSEEKAPPKEPSLPLVAGSSPKRVHGKLQRRETTSRLLDLSHPATSQMLRATTSEPTSSAGYSRTVPRQSKPGWKSSKIFNRTLTSADLMKGMKKCSVDEPKEPKAEAKASSSSDTTSKASESKLGLSLKTRLSSLRRKSSSGGSTPVSSQDVVIKVECEGESVVPRRDSIFENTGMLTPPRKKSEDEGIVCKREDLISLINKVSKKKAQGSPKANRATLRVTRSASFEPQNSNPSGEVHPDSDSTSSSNDPSRRSSLERNFPSKEETTQASLLTQEPTVKSKSPSPKNRSPLSKVSPVRIEELTVEDETERKTSVPSVDKTTPPVVKPEGAVQAEETARVQWDDGTNVNAMLMGAAIEAFLKGIGGSTAEKRVSFKKGLGLKGKK